MKKTLLLVIMLFISKSLIAQNYKPFRVHISGMYAAPTYTKAFSSGLGYSIEPAYAVDDNLAVGVRLEGAALGVGSSLKDKIGVVASYTLTADYFMFNEGNLRFFVGGGVGFFRTGTATTSSTNDFVAGGDGWGFVPRVGIQLSHLRISAEYNSAPKNMSYFGLKAGVTIGGGKK
ncbi:hypothetical protein QM480_23780 [Flectobacillus sp. DC10W]|jgi:hypothetical protein|uniref:Outer membrane protein beta-barrel domain-containing protein n=1 Tax=Flectobacillus longus TaxID=2984207 RepID=A0ABT6YVA8_9BACT|nr:hypothetical protein [Flectobacillus longus]MDI9867384.1 hypothetical protein [Flectobacillus longus]